MTDLPEPIGDDPEIVARLERDRPVPAPAFRGELGRSIAGDSRSVVPSRPDGLWLRVTICSLAGVALLLVALLLS